MLARSSVVSWLPGSCPPSSTTPAPDTQLVCFVLGYSRLWLGDQEPGARCVLTNLLLVESAYPTSNFTMKNLLRNYAKQVFEYTR